MTAKYRVFYVVDRQYLLQVHQSPRRISAKVLKRFILFSSVYIYKIVAELPLSGIFLRFRWGLPSWRFPYTQWLNGWVFFFCLVLVKR